jgi:Uma2 family endonuclease
MTAVPKTKLTVDEFIAWALDRPGRYELYEGDVVAMSPQRARHARAKAAAYLAFRAGIAKAGIPCRAMPDGMTVRIDSGTAYEPDCLVYCGPRADDDDVAIANPVIVVEAVSPSTGARDKGAKLEGYFRVPSVIHYLIVDPKLKVVIHHRREGDNMIATRIVGSGPLDLSPPGLSVDVGEFFAED